MAISFTPHLDRIEGDISRLDAIELAKLAEGCRNILEFGVGASSIFLRKYSDAYIVYMDTSQEWLDKTKNKLDVLGLLHHNNKELFFLIKNDNLEGNYLIERLDQRLIFIDGKSDLRLFFALIAFKSLTIGGKMVFHDTKHKTHQEDICKLLADKYMEIKSIECNIGGSNLTVITRGPLQVYENWNETEKNDNRENIGA